MTLAIQQRKILTLNTWKWKCNQKEEDYRYHTEYNNPRDYKEIRETQWNKEFASIVFNRECKFTELMRSKLIFGHYRYNSGKEYSLVATIKWDCRESIYIRWDKFKETNNLEFLVDVANYCMLTYTNNISEFGKLDLKDSTKPEKLAMPIDFCNFLIRMVKKGHKQALYDLTICVKWLYEELKDNPDYHYTVEDDTIHTKLK